LKANPELRIARVLFVNDVSGCAASQRAQANDARTRYLFLLGGISAIDTWLVRWFRDPHGLIGLHEVLSRHPQQRFGRI
jgi:hypothetical protein